MASLSDPNHAIDGSDFFVFCEHPEYGFTIGGHTSSEIFAGLGLQPNTVRLEVFRQAPGSWQRLWRDQHDGQVNGLMQPLPTLMAGKGCASSLNHPWIAALATLRAFECGRALQ